MKLFCFKFGVILFIVSSFSIETTLSQTRSVAREWNELLLFSISNDLARPTVHARNLFHTSAAMYDAWAVYDDTAETFFLGKNVGGYPVYFDGIPSVTNIDEARKEAISFLMYRLIKHRFKNSPGRDTIFPKADSLMNKYGYHINFTGTDYSDGNPAALGNYIAEQVIAFGMQDGANEINDYINQFYAPLNLSLDPLQPGNPRMTHPNNWQPLAFDDFFVDQSGNVIDTEEPEFLGAEWGNIIPFALVESERTSFHRDGMKYYVYHDPGPPPNIDGEFSDIFKYSFALVPIWQSHLDPSDTTRWDISPFSMGNIDINDMPTSFTDYDDFYDLFNGGQINKGHQINPYTGKPYEQQVVLRGDYARVLAEFWADGPDSETPPGHWYSILNYVNDQKDLKKKFQGTGDVLDDLEWDVKSYFVLGGAMHDAAISAWSVKSKYDYVRPISAVRWMADNGQSSDPNLQSYHPDGIPLIEGFIELISEGDMLAGMNNENLGKIKLYTWRGHSSEYIPNPEVDHAGVDWILAEYWWPYQRLTFVTPPFAGYVSGHSTFSRAAAETLTMLTGDPFFPGGIGEFTAKKNEFLKFENGPSEDIILQWATYRDASDQCSLSRIWGGIHPPIDDINGRFIGEKVAINSFNLAVQYFNGTVDANIARYPTEIPETVYLEQNFPNPFNPSTIIRFHLDRESEIKLEVFDSMGRKLRVLYHGSANAGSHEIPFEALNLSSGVYFYRLVTETSSHTRKMSIIR